MSSQPHTAHYRIGIDCRLAGSKHAGIGRYTQNLVSELVQLPESQITWVLFFSDETQRAEVIPKVPSHCEIRFAPVSHYSLKEQLHMPGIFNQAHLDLLHVPHFNVPLFYRGKLVVTIHDLLWHEQRGSAVTTLSPWKYWLKYVFYHLLVTYAVTTAKNIIVPAKTIAKTVTHYYPKVRSKIVVTYEGIAQSFLQTTTTAHPKHGTPVYELIYTGSLYPHKNIEVVLQLLQQYPDIHLTIVGSRSVFRDAVAKRCRELSVQYQVTFAGYIPDAQLVTLYAKADALIQPSLSEGFGLTGLEALAQGLPAVVSDIPIFREIYQDAAVFFNPRDPESLYEAIGIAVQKRTQLLAQSRVLLPRYNWKQMAKKTLKVYRQVLELRS